MRNSRLSGMEALLTLLTKASTNCTGEDLAILEMDQRDSVLYESRLNELYNDMLRGFFACAVQGVTFCPEQRIVSAFGKTFERNYPEASEIWLKFAKTYWTLRFLVDGIMEEDYAWIGAHLLAKLQREISHVFIPMPGPAILPPAEREKVQRKLLREFGPAIDIEDFIRGNPILIRDRFRMKQRKPDSSARGLIVMLMGCIAVFFFAWPYIGGLLAGVCAVAFFVGWVLFNRRAATIELFKANMRSYFISRSRGASHHEALGCVLETRYPSSSEKQMAVTDAFARMPCGEGEKDQLKALVYAIFCQEVGTPPDGYRESILRKLDSTYLLMSKKYARPT